MEIPSNKRSIYRENYVRNKFPEFYKFITNLFSDTDLYGEKIYRYLNNLKTRPICPECGKEIPYRNSPAGYGKYCCLKCATSSQNRSNLIKQTKSQRYGDENYNNYDKIKSTILKKYGVNNIFELQEYQEKAHRTKLEKYGDKYYIDREKFKKTCLKKYGVKNPMQSPEVKDRFKKTMVKKYGVEWAMQSPELIKKLSNSLIHSHKSGKYIETHKINNSFNTSKIEREVIKYFEEYQINYIYQYTSKLYPFNCDFYLPDYDLYIEIQGCWTHGFHPFDQKNEDDIKLLNKWKSKNTKYYDTAIYVWTDLDVRKRKQAKINKIRYLELFSINAEYIISEIIKNIGFYGTK